MQGSGSGRDGDSMLRSHDLGKILFKCIEIWSGGSDPIGLESFQDVFDFRGADVGRREVKAGERHNVKRAKVQIGAELLCKGAKVDSDNT
jgi:hypothetical protein